MSELGFVGKCLAITIVLVFLMQIKVGKNTLEQHTLGFLEESRAVDGLRYVADGAMAVGGKAWGFTTKLVGIGESQNKEVKTESASRGYSWEVKRTHGARKQERHNDASKNTDAQGPAGDEVD